MKNIIAIFALIISMIAISFPVEASELSSPVLTCNSLIGDWSGNLSNGISDFSIIVNDAGGDPDDDADIQYTDDQGGSDGASVVGNCTIANNIITMNLHSNYQAISFTITMIDAIHANISGAFTDVLGQAIQASGNVTRARI